MPAGDDKEFIIRLKKAAGDLDIVPLALRMHQQGETINKTVTYIQLALEYRERSGGPYYLLHPIHYYHEDAKFDGTVNVYFEATHKIDDASRTSKVELRKVGGALITTLADNSAVAVRQRSAGISLTDLESYHVFHGETGAEAGASEMWGARLVIKQTGGVTKTKVHVPLDAGGEVTDKNDPYEEGHPNAHDWDPGDMEDVTGVFLEIMGKENSSYHEIYSKLRNHTDNVDITGSDIFMEGFTVWTRIRSGDFNANMPATSKELRSWRKSGSGATTTTHGNRFLIIEQSWIPLYEVKDGVEHDVSFSEEVKDAIEHLVAFEYPSAKDGVEHLVETYGQWVKDAVEHVVETLGEIKDAVEHAVDIVGEIKDGIAHEVLLLDEEGPYIVAGTLSPVADARGVLATAKIQFSIADNDEVNIATVKCKVTTYMLDDSQTRVHEQSTTYDKDSAEWSHADVNGDGSRYDVEIDPPDYPDGHFVEREITADDNQGNPGVVVK